MMTLLWSRRLFGRSSAPFALALALGLYAPCAAAQQPAGESKSESKEETARKLYEEGIKRYNVADYAAAIASFRQAYLLSDAPEMLYNIAQSYRLSGPGNCRSALQFYRNFLRVEPKTAKRASVEAAIADMERCAKDEPLSAQAPEANKPVDEPPQPKPEPKPAPNEPPKTEAQASQVLPLALMIGGGALTLTGVGLLGWSRVRYDDLEGSGCAPACDPARTDGPRAAQTVGGVLAGVGGAVLLGGALVWLLGRPASTATAASAWITAAQHGVRF